LRPPFAHIVCVGFASPGFAAGDSQLAASSCKPLTHVQRRVVEKADQGVEALRDYVFVTRATHQLDMMEIAAKLDGWRVEARCAERLADAAATRR